MMIKLNPSNQPSLLIHDQNSNDTYMLSVIHFYFIINITSSEMKSAENVESIFNRCESSLMSAVNWGQKISKEV